LNLQQPVAYAVPALRFLVYHSIPLDAARGCCDNLSAAANPSAAIIINPHRLFRPPREMLIYWAQNTMSLITLTTDFGLREGYPAVMKGVIYGILPHARLVDITHQVQPQNLYEAAFILEISAFFFPENTVHVVVVDPGVGTARRPLAARIGSQFFVAPDNGVLSRVLLRAEREGWSSAFVHADQPAYWLADRSATFHGRDIFAPLAAHLAGGVPLEKIGTPICDPQMLPIRQPQRSADGVSGEVIHIDHFGNAITSITAADIQHLGQVQVSLCGKTTTGILHTFSDCLKGEICALWDSSNYLMVSEYGGLKQIHPAVGDAVLVSPLTSGRNAPRQNRPGY